MGHSGNWKGALQLLLLGLVLSDCFDFFVRSEAAAADYRPSMFTRRQLSVPWVSCTQSASVCKDPKKNPYPAAATCCGKRVCVDLESDESNCGTCGKSCKYGEACCGGKCVNLLKHMQNCGRCNYPCPSTTVCSFGMCGYAAGGY